MRPSGIWLRITAKEPTAPFCWVPLCGSQNNTKASDTSGLQQAATNDAHDVQG